jgi:hypothetical protein
MLLNTYEDHDEAELALQKVSGKCRLASERDGTETIYNLFGEPCWSNFYKLNMYQLTILKDIIEKRSLNKIYDQLMHEKIISSLKHVESHFNIKIPAHWL